MDLRNVSHLPQTNRTLAHAFALHQDKYNYQAVFGALLDKIKDW